MTTSLVAGAELLLLEVGLQPRGISVRFADDLKGLVPFTALNLRPGDIRALSPNDPYLLTVHLKDGTETELPSDLLRYHVDANFKSAEDRADALSATTFGHRLVTLRKQAGLSQGALALRCKVSRATLARLEAGHFFPRLPTLEKLATGLNLPLEDLMSPPDNAYEGRR